VIELEDRCKPNMITHGYTTMPKGITNYRMLAMLRGKIRFLAIYRVVALCARLADRVPQWVGRRVAGSSSMRLE